MIDEKFEQFLVENPMAPIANGILGAGNNNEHELYELSSIDSINAYLAALTARPFINPYYAIDDIKVRCASFGIDFEGIDFTEDYDTVTRPVKQWGKPTGHVISITYFKNKGLFTLGLEVSPAPVEEEVNISEEEKIEEGELDPQNGGKQAYAIKVPGANYTHTQGKKGLLPAKALRAKILNFDPRAALLPNDVPNADLNTNKSLIKR
jgi:hypothetical protein